MPSGVLRDKSNTELCMYSERPLNLNERNTQVSKNDVPGDLARFGLPADQGSAGPSAGGLEMASVLLLLTRHSEGPAVQRFFVSALHHASCSDQLPVTTPYGSETSLQPLARAESTGLWR